MGLGAQEDGGANLQQGESPNRPAETDLLLDQGSEQVGEAGDAPAPIPGVGVGDFIRIILVLAFIIVLIYAFFWVLKRFSGVKAVGEDFIRLVSTRPLKGDAALHLVETGGRFFLVGSSGNSVNLVAEIDNKESVDELRLEMSRAAPPSSGFTQQLRRKFAGGLSTRTGAETGNSDDPGAYLRRRRERLKDL